MWQRRQGEATDSDKGTTVQPWSLEVLWWAHTLRHRDLTTDLLEAGDGLDWGEPPIAGWTRLSFAKIWRILAVGHGKRHRLKEPCSTRPKHTSVWGLPGFSYRRRVYSIFQAPNSWHFANHFDTFIIITCINALLYIPFPVVPITPPHQRHVCASGDLQETGVEELDEQGQVRGDAWMKKLLGIDIIQKQLGNFLRQRWHQSVDVDIASTWLWQFDSGSVFKT